MQQLTQKLKDGVVEVNAVPIPVVQEGAVLVRNHYSLVSSGTEGGTVKTARKGLIGKAKALELLLTGSRISAQEAYRLGLVNSVVPAGEALTEATKLASRLSAQSSVVLEAIILTVNEGLGLPPSKGLRIEADRFATLFQTEDMREGVSAFIEKRRPHFKDR